jgi:hypothetical protein
MEKCLTHFLKFESEDTSNFIVNENFSFSIFPSTKRYDDVFLLGSFSDNNSGGFVVSEVYKNLQLCITEKTKKIENVRDKYEEWWIVLIDYIGYGLSQRDLDQLHEIEKIQHTWGKIILVDPLNPENGVEI